MRLPDASILVALLWLGCPGDDDDSALDDDDAVDDDDSAEIDPCIEAPLGSIDACPAIDCEEILRGRPDAEDGTYWIEGDGSYRAFEVGCDMTTDGGGWMRLSLEESDNVLVGSQSDTNPWLKCDDDVLKHYGWLDDEAAVEMDYAPGGSFQDAFEPEYRDTVTDAILTGRMVDALRPVLQDLHPSTRMVATTGDDDGNSWQDGSGSGMEVYVVGTNAEWILLTPGTNGECGGAGGSWPAGDSESAFYIWSTDGALSETDGDVGEDPITLGALPAAGILPRTVHIAVFTGGGVSFGWETQIFLVR
jgi:hypothetical protein